MTQSNEPTIDDKNGVIAVFDGYQFFKGDPNHKCNFCFAGDEPCTPAVDRFVKDCSVVFHYELKYHISWDCLKPVIDEIFRYSLAHPEEARPVRELSIVVDIQAAHDKVYKFCKWFNQQKQKG